MQNQKTDQIREAWFDKFCAEKKVYQKNCASLDCLAFAASKLSYRASVLRALYDRNGQAIGFQGKVKEKVECRSEYEKLIENFLIDALNGGAEKADSFRLNIETMWDKVRACYHGRGIDWYTYGNAQKWVGMALKYFIVMLLHEDEIKMDYPLVQNSLFPVDGIMIGKIKEDLSVKFSGTSWSKCDDKEVFAAYIDAVKEQVKSKGLSLFEYELLSWAGEK